MNDPLRSLAPALGTALVMVALVLKEPDMGTALHDLADRMVMLCVAGLSLNNRRRYWRRFPRFMC